MKWTSRITRGAAICLMAVALAGPSGPGLTAAPALAAGTTTLQLQRMQVQIQDRNQSVDYKMVPDERGHVLALVHRQGKARLSDGATAHYAAYSIIDAWVGKRGIRKGYSILAFSDGSKIFYAWKANSKRNHENLPSLKGQGIITRGTGRYQGIKGKVEMQGTQLKPTKEDPKRARVTELVITYSVP